VNESALGPQEKHLSLSIQRSETASSVGDIGSPSLLSYLSPSIQHMFNGVNSTPWFLHGSTPPEPLKSFNTSMILLELLRSGRRGTPLLVFLLIKRQPVRCSLNWIFKIIRKIVLSYLVPLLLAGSFPEYSILNGNRDVHMEIDLAKKNFFLIDLASASVERRASSRPGRKRELHKEGRFKTNSVTLDISPRRKEVVGLCRR